LAHNSPLLPGVPHVPSGERSIRTGGFPWTRAFRSKDFVNCVERPVDQFHDFVLRAMRREALKLRQDRTRREKQERYGRAQIQERGEMRPPTLRAGRESTVVLYAIAATCACFCLFVFVFSLLVYFQVLLVALRLDSPQRP